MEEIVMIGIFYVHGFNSALKQSKIDALSNILDSKRYKVIGTQWNSEDTFDNNVATLINQINSVSDQFDDIVIIGCSLGGFYARYIACKLNCYAVLINPVVEPLIQMEPLIGSFKNYVTGNKYEFTDKLLQSYAAGLVKDTCNCLTYVSRTDKILPNNTSFVYFYRQLYGKIIETETEHRVDDYSQLPNFAEEINTLVNTLAG